MTEPIFPENWDKKKRKLKHWRSEETQERICPKCHCYTQRFKHDQICQFCGFEPEAAEERVWTTEELIEILIDWHKYAHGVGKIGYCNNDKCQSALKEIKARVTRPQLRMEYKTKDGWVTVTKLEQVFGSKVKKSK